METLALAPFKPLNHLIPFSSPPLKSFSLSAANPRRISFSLDNPLPLAIELGFPRVQFHLKLNSHVARCQNPSAKRKIGRRDTVVRSQLAAAGSPGAEFPVTEFQSDPKFRGICFYSVTSVVAIFSFAAMVAIHPLVLLFDRHRRKAHHWIAGTWAALTIAPFYNVRFEGLENLPSSDTAAVYVSNHQSFLDIYTLLTLRKSFKFISKTSIFVYPVIGWAMYLMGVIPLRRMDSSSQLDCLRRCMDLVKKGASVFFFPEGTRSKDGKLGLFKKGAFSVAAKNDAPVVPITLMGTGSLMPPGMEGLVNSGSVKVVIHKPIQGKNADTLCEEARNIIADTLIHNGYEVHQSKYILHGETLALNCSTIFPAKGSRLVMDADGTFTLKQTLHASTM